jgi:DNA modification methylase
MIIHGDCIDVLKTLEPDNVDCCITDPIKHRVEYAQENANRQGTLWG